MKKKYADTLPMLKELFSDWSDEDLVFLLEDTDGDLEVAVERITEGLWIYHSGYGALCRR